MNVKIYSTDSCPYCMLAKEYLDEKGISYENVNVSEDSEKAQEMIEISGQMGVPVIVIDNKIIVGFDKDRLDQIIK